MTALLVLESTTDFAQITKVSRRADQTFGTTASIQAGEELSVEQLLHALLLPSRNDAAVVLAEYFGRGYSRQPGENFQTGFVNRMNERARELTLSNTTFVDPHGPGNNESSAADLLVLSHIAMQDPRFAKFVSKRQYALNIRSLQGDMRAVTWKNTNTLLNLPYFSGIKTGHSNSAEGCLITSGHHRGVTLQVVVLRSLNQKTRFIDAQNLFQRALRKIAEKNNFPTDTP
jgi:D-alanyl-D-alanine carboxypeptidase (penicillin-binding protein 5/6)